MELRVFFQWEKLVEENEDMTFTSHKSTPLSRPYLLTIELLIEGVTSRSTVLVL